MIGMMRRSPLSQLPITLILFHREVFEQPGNLVSVLIQLSQHSNQEWLDRCTCVSCGSGLRRDALTDSWTFSSLAV